MGVAIGELLNSYCVLKSSILVNETPVVPFKILSECSNSWLVTVTLD